MSLFLYNEFMKYVILDFNGTVLDDIDVCIKAENKTIEHFKLDRPPITKEEYLDIFTFPVKNYYEMLYLNWLNKLFNSKKALDIQELFQFVSLDDLQYEEFKIICFVR